MKLISKVIDVARRPLGTLPFAKFGKGILYILAPLFFGILCSTYNIYKHILVHKKYYCV